VDYLEIPGVAELQELTLGDSGIVVAVLDGVACVDHPCFEGADLVLEEPYWTDDREPDSKLVQHATFVASVLFGQPGTNVTGLAPRCAGIIIAVGRDEQTVLSPVDLARAIEFAVERDADLIHIAACLPSQSLQAEPLVERALRMALDAGVLIVAPVGNNYSENFCIPAAFPGVLAAGALRQDGEPFGFNNRGGPYLDQAVFTLGEYEAADPGGGLKRHDGSSCAAPIVSGVSALLLSLQKQRGMPSDAAAVRRAILETATPVASSEDPEVTLRGDLNVTAATEVLLANRLPSGEALSRKIEPSAMPPDRPRPIFALGSLDYDFGNDTVRDSFLRAAPQVVEPAEMVAYLRANPVETRRLTWVLRIGPSPAYVIEPSGSYASDVYELLVSICEAQLMSGDDGVDRMSLPGIVGSGVAQLLSGESVPVARVAGVRGISAWATDPLVASAAAAAGVKPDAIKAPLGGFLTHIYKGRRNLGQLRKDRAMNFAATNAFQAAWVFAHAHSTGLKFDELGVEKSPYCRPGSDCWNMRIRFIDPENDLRADYVYRYTIDVSDVYPVTLGSIRSWPVMPAIA